MFVMGLLEQRRRDRINEKMRALQELIPNCNKVDMLSEIHTNCFMTKFCYSCYLTAQIWTVFYFGFEDVKLICGSL